MIALFFFHVLGARSVLFKTEGRGRNGFVASAEMRSPLFNDQRCLKFQSFLFGHPRDTLIVYKKGEKRRQELVRVSPGKTPLFWRSHQITVTPQLCNSYEVFVGRFVFDTNYRMMIITSNNNDHDDKE